MAALYNKVFLGVTEDSIRHISRAYSLINERLSVPVMPSDESIAVVCALAAHQRVIGQHAVGKVHFDGLCRMLQLRGGITRVYKEHRRLTIKPWRYGNFLSNYHG